LTALKQMKYFKDLCLAHKHIFPRQFIDESHEMPALFHQIQHFFLFVLQMTIV